MRLPPLPNTQQLIRLYGLSAKQQLSQNFLLDMNICRRFARQLKNVVGGTIIEIGPGPGGITRALLMEGAERVIVIEKDKRFIPALQLIQQQALFPNSKESRLVIVNGDALEENEEELLSQYMPKEYEEDPTKCKVGVIGNLPFAVSTACLIKWVKQASKREGVFAFGRAPCALAFQAEVADRIVAKPKTKEYGRLSIMSQQWMHTDIGFTITGKSFVPPPKVDARIIKFEGRSSPLEPTMTDADILEATLRIGFGQRRKFLKNSFKGFGPTVEEIAKMIVSIGIDANARAEDISVKDWCKLTKVLDARMNLRDKLPSSAHKN